jgi:hypothetical protein
MEIEAWLLSAARGWNQNWKRREEITADDIALCEKCQKALAEPPHEQQALFRKAGE